VSAPFLWLVLPVIVALTTLLLRYQRVLVTVIAVGAALFLAWAAWQLPIDQPLELGPLTLKLSDTLTVLGRNFTLADSERPFLALMYFGTACWLWGAYFARPGHLFVPISLAVVPLLIATLAVEPFLYAALMIEITALLLIPVLVPVGGSPGRGVFRFLAFQTLGMPFILFTGWLLAGAEASPGDLDLVLRAGLLLALGFAFLLAIFPFHTWVPMLGEEAHPYVAAFVFLFLPGVISIFALGFLDRYAWLRESAAVYDVLRVLGALMIVVGGLWAAVQSHLGRLLGFIALCEIGFSLLAISVRPPLGVQLFFLQALPRAVALPLLGLALSDVRQLFDGSLWLETLQGQGRRYPLLVGALLLGVFSLAGLPLLAAFPMRLALSEALFSLQPAAALLALLGSLGLVVAALRILRLAFSPLPAEQPSRSLSPGLQVDPLIGAPANASKSSRAHPRISTHWLVYALGVALLFAIGLFPAWFSSLLADLPAMFVQIGS